MSRTGPVKIAARATDLAQRHAGWVAERLSELGQACVLVGVATTGDPGSTGTWRGEGVRVTSVQAAVREGQADVAVRQFDELPATPADGLEVAAVPRRAAAHDVLLLLPTAFDPGQARLPVRRGARIGASAAHRTSQLRALRPDLLCTPVRGDPLARIDVLRAGAAVDGLIVAAFALDRLAADLSGLQRVDLDGTLLPAPGQGALALEVRRGDPLIELLAQLHDLRGFPAVAAERALLGLLPAGRQLDLAAHCTVVDGGRLLLDAWLGGVRAQVRAGSSEDAALLAYGELGRPARASS